VAAAKRGVPLHLCQRVVELRQRLGPDDGRRREAGSRYPSSPAARGDRPRSRRASRPAHTPLRLESPISATGARIGASVAITARSRCHHRLYRRACPGRSIVGSERRRPIRRRRTAIQSVISGQIDAFRHDDARAAFAAASPGIQSKFLNADIFMAMVAGGYAPVYRPKSFAFGPLAATGGGPRNACSSSGRTDSPYVRRLPDGAGAGRRWRIDAVSIERGHPAQHLARRADRNGKSPGRTAAFSLGGWPS